MKREEISVDVGVAALLASALSRLSLAEVVDIMENSQVLLRDMSSGEVQVCACPASLDPSIGRVAVVLELDQPSKPRLMSIVGLLGHATPVVKNASCTPSQVHVQANERLVLQCGDASLSLERDGTVRLKGRRISSRANEKNVVSGASVHLN